MVADAPAGAGPILELDATDPRWASKLPAVPPDSGISLSVTDVRELAAAAALAERGYRVVGVAWRAAPARQRLAHIHVPEALASGHPSLYRALAAQARRVLLPAHGPVAVVLADVLAAHWASD